MIPLFKDPTSGLKGSPTDRLPLTYNTITFNAPGEPITNTFELEDVAVTPITDQVIEQKQGKDGLEIYQAFKGGMTIRLSGFVKAPNYAALFDKAQLLAEKMDAALLSRRFSTSTLGFLPLGFSVPTADTTNYPSGLVDSFYLARTMSAVTWGSTKYDDISIPYKIDMICRDPRRFFTTLQSRSGAGQMDNTLASYPSWPTVTITRSAASPWVNYQIQNTNAFGGPKTLTLDMTQTVNGDIITVDMERKTIKVNGITKMSLYVTGDYWMIEPRLSQTLTLAQTTGTSTVVSWYRAFAV